MSIPALNSSMIPIIQPINISNSENTLFYSDSTVYRKKAKDYAEETRALLLQGISKKDNTKPIDRKLTRSSMELLGKHAISKPKITNSTSNVKLDRITSTSNIKSKDTESTYPLKKDRSCQNTNTGKKVQSLYDLDKRDCDFVQSILDGSTADISLSMGILESQSKKQEKIHLLDSSILLYTASQKTPIILPNSFVFKPNLKTVNDGLLTHEYESFNRNRFNFYKDYSKLCEYEDIHHKNVVNLISRDLDKFKKENTGSISDGELVQMVYSCMIHIDGKVLMNDLVLEELQSTFESGLSSFQSQRQLVLELKSCTSKIPKADLLELKAVIGHIRRLAIVYGYHKSIHGLTLLFSELIFSCESVHSEYLNVSPKELYEIIIKGNGPQTKSSAILELILYFYNIFF